MHKLGAAIIVSARSFDNTFYKGVYTNEQVFTHVLPIGATCLIPSPYHLSHLKALLELN